LPLALLTIATIALTVGAWLYTETGSIDRWWYLAYVRDFINSDAITGAEPFLGSGNVLARFAWNTWLLSFAAWAHFSATDPTALYEHASVIFLAPVAVSSAIFLGRATFDTWRMAMITGLCSILIWTSGTLLPAMTRLPEDKLLAILILAPVLIGTVVRAAVGGLHGWPGLRRRNWVPVVAVAALAIATVHSFVYAVALIVAVPFLIMFAINRQTNRSVAATLVTILLIFGGLSYGIGSAARDSVVATGATIENLDHPVVRVHMSQDRLVDIGMGHIVSPKLLVHPLIILGFLALLPLMRRSYKERYLITPATFIALSIAFLAPLTWLVGQLVLPWMVYRILWAIPFALLLAVVIDEFGRTIRMRPSFVFAALLLGVFPWTRGAITAHERPERQVLALPQEGELAALTSAIVKLPDDTVLVATAQLSERLPALTGKNVLALSDRGTVVFAGDRELAEKRLQARTAALIGLWRPVDGVPDPTHIIFAPDSPAARYCSEPIFAGDNYQLCEFTPANPIPGVRLYETKGEVRDILDANSEENETVLFVGIPQNQERDSGNITIECTPAPEKIGRTIQWKQTDPWTAAAPGMTCTLTPQNLEEMPLFVPRNLVLDPFLGSAAEEVVISATAWRDGIQRWSLRTRRRILGDIDLAYDFPQTRIDKLEVKIAPAYLPFLKLRDLVVTFEDAAVVRGKDAKVHTATDDDIAPTMNIAATSAPKTAEPKTVAAATKKPATDEQKSPVKASKAPPSQKTSAKPAPESLQVPATQKDPKPTSLRTDPVAAPEPERRAIETPKTAVAPSAGGIVSKVSTGTGTVILESEQTRPGTAGVAVPN
jgi:hypothetical protein